MDGAHIAAVWFLQFDDKQKFMFWYARMKTTTRGPNNSLVKSYLTFYMFFRKHFVKVENSASVQY